MCCKTESNAVKNFLFDEVALGLRNRNVPEAEITESSSDLENLWSLSVSCSWPLSALSHGQKRRAAIAAILVLDPELILLMSRQRDKTIAITPK